MDAPIAHRPDYGFIIDNRKCIGCHACSTACKSENEVPLGVYRTWVKYVETGRYPDVRRHFQVTRCNHCANPPCARICPTGAMFQRDDGIVEFDNTRCIGCKACLQACPYDAIHIDPDSGTAAKCHYCAHRTDLGLEPACVVVCPEHAIIAGDMNDPLSEISRILAKEQVTVRKPEQGTAPKLFYIDGAAPALVPTATQMPESFLWADVVPRHGDHPPATPRVHLHTRTAQPQGEPAGGPITIGGRVAEQMVQQSYNVQHKIPWHWPVPAYLVTKGIAAGLFALLFLLNVTVASRELPRINLVLGFVSLLFTAITTFFLVIDLERPERFLYILRYPQWRSWLTRGAVLLIGFSTVAGVWWLIELAKWMGWIQPGPLNSVSNALLWIGQPLALGAAIYTAYLFAQAEGRDLWQSALLPFHLLVQALLGGSATALLVGPLLLTRQANADVAGWALPLFVGSLLVNLFVTLVGEFSVPHASEVAARAAHAIKAGHYRHHFWLGAIVLGHLVPLALLLLGAPLWSALAAIAALVGLYLYEYAYVMAPQEVPNS